jgi:tetratricopeptide (TPR) repeat protein
MNKLSLISALIFSAAAHGPADHALSRAEQEHFGPAARGDSSSAWEASYAAETAGKLDDAINALTDLPAAQRNGYLASYRRGWLLYRLGRYPESVAAYRSAVGQEPAAVEARVALLLPLMALTKWNDVAQVAQDVLKLDPENYLALSRLALAKFSTQRFGEADTLYRRILALYPSDIEMRAGLGWTALRMSKQAQAIAQFNQVLEVAPKHVSATRGLQEARAGKGSD